MLRKFILGLTATLAVGAPVALAAAPAQAAIEDTPTIRTFSATAEFFPTVRDGYKDVVAFRGQADTITDEDNFDDVEQTWNITVRNAKGRKVAERNGRWPDYDGVWWDWNGKDQRTGKFVGVGTYKSTLTVTNPWTGATDTSVKTIKAKSGTMNKRITKTRAPRDTTTRKARGCVIRNGSWDSARDLHLDCVGGKYAEATYRFKIPAGATKVSWSLPWESDGSMPWGRVSKSGKRTSPTTFVIKARVTEYRGMFVNNVVLSYNTKVRV